MIYLYLHGFASGPKSAKGIYLQQCLQQYQIPLAMPDLNQPTFTDLTLTHQIQHIKANLPDQPVTLVGSSLGGLVATWVAEHQPQVQRLILLAPAFNFLSHWLPTLSPETLRQWQHSGYHRVYHYAYQAYVPLHYAFVTDAQQYNDHHDLKRSVPTLILHGCHDEVIPIGVSRDYATHHQAVDLVELDSDHALANSYDLIWSYLKSTLVELNL